MLGLQDFSQNFGQAIGSLFLPYFSPYQRVSFFPPWAESSFSIMLLQGKLGKRAWTEFGKPIFLNLEVRKQLAERLNGKERGGFFNVPEFPSLLWYSQRVFWALNNRDVEL